MTNGSVTLNGLTDKQLVTVLEAKIHHEGKLFFNPQTVQLQTIAGNRTVNNNVIVTWQTEDGFKSVIGLLAELAGHKVVATEVA